MFIYCVLNSVFHSESENVIVNVIVIKAMNRAGRGGAPNPMDPETLTEMLKGNILNMVVSF